MHEASPESAAPELVLRYRSVYGAPPPRRIRLPVPGWGGSSKAHADGARAQPWHCRPFVEGATLGLELLYPYPGECRVVHGPGGVSFEGDVDPGIAAGEIEHPFGRFAAEHYGMATALDLLPPPGYALRLGPHPRFFTDTTGTVPLALPGQLQRFWPRQFFAVFRLPPAGGEHVFRRGEPYAQLLLVPTEQRYAVAAMEPELAADRGEQERRIATYGPLLARKIWRSDAGIWFNDKYRQLLRLFRGGGMDAVRERLMGVDRRRDSTGA